MENSFVQQALLSLNTQSNPVLTQFFSDSNILRIQKELKQQVRRHTNQTISEQSCNEIYTVMKYMYVNHGKVYMKKNDREVLRLNDSVLQELVPMVSSNVLQYLQYIKDINNLPVPMEYGKTTSVKGDNSLELKSF